MFENTGRTEIASLGEFGLIEHLSKNITHHNSSTIKGVGDDAAIINHAAQQTVLSTDLLLEGVHFDLAYVPLKHLGYKSIMVNLSDIYAMNAKPTQVLVSLGFSSRFSLEAVEEIALVSNKTTKAPSVNNNSAISVDGVTSNESNVASVFVEDITTNEVNSEVSSVVNNTKTEKVNSSSKVSSAKEVASSKSMNSTKIVKKALKNDMPKGLLYLLCFLMPWLAVGFATDWDIKTVIINILWTFLCGIPGIIHAIIIVGRNS